MFGGTLVYKQSFPAVLPADGVFSLHFGPTGEASDAPTNPLTTDLATAIGGDAGATSPSRSRACRSWRRRRRCATRYPSARDTNNDADFVDAGEATLRAASNSNQLRLVLDCRDRAIIADNAIFALGESD